MLSRHPVGGNLGSATMSRSILWENACPVFHLVVFTGCIAVHRAEITQICQMRMTALVCGRQRRVRTKKSDSPICHSSVKESTRETHHVSCIKKIRNQY